MFRLFFTRFILRGKQTEDILEARKIVKLAIVNNPTHESVGLWVKTLKALDKELNRRIRVAQTG